MNYNSIKLEKGMYANGKSLTDILEELDPSENYKNTDMSGLDAFQRQLKRYDIKVGGSDSDQVQKFFQTSNSAALFPEYVARAVKQGMKNAAPLSEIVAATTVIDNLDYRSISVSPLTVSADPVSEGGLLPQTDIRTNSNLVSLKKHGRLLTASYEAIKYQRLDIFTVTLRQIGAYIARELFNDAVYVLVNGDGGNNAAETVSADSQTLTYGSLIKLWANIAP
ncbi:MAG: phage major capsid protein, partial [Clostridia bacterium]|nr:phage major capsid protein [Clostridia bacterium]